MSLLPFHWCLALFVSELSIKARVHLAADVTFPAVSAVNVEIRSTITAVYQISMVQLANK